MPNVRTVVHRDIHFIDTTEDGHRITIAKGVKGGKYEGMEGRGRSKQAAYDNLLAQLAEIAAFQAQPQVQERERRCREVLDRIDRGL
jgi:hypothetical protein